MCLDNDGSSIEVHTHAHCLRNVHVCMLPKYLACHVHVQRCQGHGSGIVKLLDKS